MVAMDIKIMEVLLRLNWGIITLIHPQVNMKYYKILLYPHQEMTILILLTVQQRGLQIVKTLREKYIINNILILIIQLL